MKRSHRRFHALIWPVLGGLIAVIVVAGLAAKQPQPRAPYSAGERSAP